jgi:hypothetical protein
MSEDRLENALNAIKNENVNDKDLAGAHDRTWEKLKSPGEILCAEFQLQIPEYRDGKLDGNHILLMEDHLSRCPQCREKLAELKGDRPATVIPMRRKSQWPRWGTWAAAAAVFLAVIYLGRSNIDTLLAQGPRATVASVSGGLYLVPEGALKSGSAIGEKQVVRTGPGAHAILRLADGSLVEVNERSELSVHAAWSGKVINLDRGDIIVQAAKQHRGYLRVQTRDSLASVKGTVFAVSAGLSGTLVSVVEGSVAVAQANSEVLLSPGEQAASNPALAGSVQQAVSWSPDAETYFSILASVAKIEKQIAGLPSPLLRTQSRLIQYLPPDTIVYGAIPNLGDTITQAMGFVEQQSTENPAFGQWWNSSAGQGLSQLIERMRTVTYLLGDEIVFAVSLGSPETNVPVPVILAEVKPGKHAELASALDLLRAQMGQSTMSYNLSDTLLVFSNSATHLQWLLATQGQGAATPFASEIAARYQDGAGWLLGVNMDSILSKANNNFINAQQVKHLFFERRDLQGAEENQLTVTFKGPRMGLASFLANAGSGGAAEYISSDAIVAIYASTREPRQMFDELITLISRSDPSVLNHLAEAEAKLGVKFSEDFAASLGTESALGIESFSTSGPVWIMAGLVNNASTLETVIQKLVEACNAESAIQGSTQQVTLLKETVDGRTWTALKFAQAPVTITWTYDRGYIVAGSDRGAVLRAIAIRNGGSPLIWSAAFKQQLPASAGMHPSAFAWLNTKGALQGFASLAPNPMIQKLLSERDPILVVFSATTEQIQAVSRTRLSGLIMDMMLLRGIHEMQDGSQPQQ